MMRTALENLRYKACTAADINFWRSKISSSSLGRSSISDKDFRDVSIITGTNLQKDEINRLGAICFAQETNQDLVDFYSEVVFAGLVRSGLLTLRNMDRDLDWSTVTIKGKKTGLNRPRPQFSVHGLVLTSPGLNWFKTGLDRFFY